MMNVDDSEKFYDDEVATVLAALGKKCTGLGLSFVSVVCWSREDVGITRASVLGQEAPQVRWASYAALGGGNIDHLILRLVNEAKKTGHNSVFLAALGGPSSPESVGLP